MFKRLVVAASVSAVAMIGFGPATGASAAPSEQSVVKVAKTKAPAAGYSTLRIDWD